MEDVVTDTAIFTQIILLTAQVYAGLLNDVIALNNAEIEVLCLEHPSQILLLTPLLLSRSRLISFGSRYYVGSDILKKIGFGAYNFHPGPSTYPGWAPFNFAMYDGVEHYGVTVHEMTDKIDSGYIVGQNSFSIGGVKNIQDLMDLTTLNMYALFNKLAPNFVQNARLRPVEAAMWKGQVNTKKHFKNKCQFSLDMNKEEFDRRYKAFGDGDGEQLPFIMKDNKIYDIAIGTEPANHESLWLHGQRFVRRA